MLSAKVLGFSGTSILLPEALATVGAVVLVYHLVKRAFGDVAGLLAGLMLAVVPVSVVVGRNNTIDSLLVFTLLLAVWTGLKATERGSLKWLLATGAIVGLGFEIKMLEAYLVVPALGLVYLLGAPISRRARLAHLALAGAVMLAVSLAWPLYVDLTPANLRPWVDSTQDNSAISLALGYNGLERLFGQNRSLGQFLSGLGLHLGTTDTSTTAGDGFGGPGGLFNNGPAGPFRLFDQQLGGQASWLLPLSLVGLLLTAWRAFEDRATLARSRRGQAGIVFGTWLLGAGAFFSVANFFHSYYLVTLGPPIATLAAIGLCSAWRAFRAGGRLAWLLPAALLGTALVQVHLLSSYPAWSQWLSPLVVTGATLGAALLTLTLVRERCVPVRERRLPLARTATSLAMMALLVAPTVWSGYTTLHSTTFGIPAAGPQVAGQFGGFGGTTPPAGFGGPNGIADDGSRGARVDGTRSGTPDGGQPGSGGPDAVDSALVSYLEANQGSATYLAATMNSNSAASLILASGQPVMSLGGFSGDDPILTVDQFASLVSSGQVRYVLLGGGGGPGGRGSNAAISQWVQASGSPVTLSAASGGFGNQLYDLSSLQGAAA